MSRWREQLAKSRRQMRKHRRGFLFAPGSSACPSCHCAAPPTVTCESFCWPTIYNGSLFSCPGYPPGGLCFGANGDVKSDPPQEIVVNISGLSSCCAAFNGEFTLTWVSNVLQCGSLFPSDQLFGISRGNAMWWRYDAGDQICPCDPPGTSLFSMRYVHFYSGFVDYDDPARSPRQRRMYWGQYIVLETAPVGGFTGNGIAMILADRFEEFTPGWATSPGYLEVPPWICLNEETSLDRPLIGIGPFTNATTRRDCVTPGNTWCDFAGASATARLP